MNKNLYWWSAIVITVVVLTTIFILDAVGQNKQQEFCKKERMQPFNSDLFTMQGINKLNSTGKLQPKCL